MNSRQDSNGMFDGEIKSNFFKPSKFSAYKTDNSMSPPVRLRKFDDPHQKKLIMMKIH